MILCGQTDACENYTDVEGTARVEVGGIDAISTVVYRSNSVLQPL